MTFQYWETVIRKTHFEPEKELMLAVLKDAIRTYKKCLHSENTRFKEVEAWLFERDRERLFSYESVCAVLGLSCENIRKGLLAWRLNAVANLACTEKMKAARREIIVDLSGKRKTLQAKPLLCSKNESLRWPFIRIDK